MKLLSLREWRPRHLVAAWSTYWAGLAAVTVGPAILAVLRLTTDPDSHGSASAGIDDGIAQVTVVDGAATVWSGSASLGEIGLWIVGPPLLLWIAWLLVRPRRAPTAGGVDRVHEESALAGDVGRPALREPGAEYISREPTGDRHRDPVRRRKP